MIDQIQIFRRLALLEKRFDNLIKPELPAGVDPTGHTHSKLVAPDGAPDPALSADASGYLSAAVQPLFSAYNSASDANVTGDGTVYTIICDTEIVDRNGNYNNATGVFTAPVDGNCLFCTGVLLAGLGAFNAVQLSFNTSNRNYYTDYLDADQVQEGGYYLVKGSVIADMDAADTAQVQVQVAGGGKTVDVYGAATAWTFFQGYLLI